MSAEHSVRCNGIQGVARKPLLRADIERYLETFFAGYTAPPTAPDDSGATMGAEKSESKVDPHSQRYVRPPANHQQFPDARTRLELKVVNGYK